MCSVIKLVTLSAEESWSLLCSICSARLGNVEYHKTTDVITDQSGKTIWISFKLQHLV